MSRDLIPLPQCWFAFATTPELINAVLPLMEMLPLVMVLLLKDVEPDPLLAQLELIVPLLLLANMFAVATMFMPLSIPHQVPAFLSVLTTLFIPLLLANVFAKQVMFPNAVTLLTVALVLLTLLVVPRLALIFLALLLMFALKLMVVQDVSPLLLTRLIVVLTSDAPTITLSVLIPI